MPTRAARSAAGISHQAPATARVAGVVVAPHGRAFSVMAFTVKNGKIVQIDALLDPERLEQLELSIPPRIEHR